MNNLIANAAIVLYALASLATWIIGYHVIVWIFRTVSSLLGY
jgi:hypothetical protein